MKVSANRFLIYSPGFEAEVGLQLVAVVWEEAEGEELGSSGIGSGWRT